jgi:nitronate monooxygenase
VSILEQVEHPLVLAPLAGGPSTPELTAAAAEAGAFSFLAGGYLSGDQLHEQLARTRALTSRPFGVNLFVPGSPSYSEVVAEYARRIEPIAQVHGVQLGEARFDDDAWDAKVAILLDDTPAVVSFTFGCPHPSVIARFRDAGAEVWVTVTTPAEGSAAVAAGARGLVAQGSEAGGHRGTWRTDDPDIRGIGVLALVQLLRVETAVPIIAAGGIATGGAVAAVLDVGADAAAAGTAFLLCPEAGTSGVHRIALAGDAPTELTRAFTGRMARGIRNRFLDELTVGAPSAYPEIHHLTAPLRRAGRANGDGDVVNLWAGQAYPLARAAPAADVVDRFVRELAAARATPG